MKEYLFSTDRSSGEDYYNPYPEFSYVYKCRVRSAEELSNALYHNEKEQIAASISGICLAINPVAGIFMMTFVVREYRLMKKHFENARKLVDEEQNAYKRMSVSVKKIIEYETAKVIGSLN